jgi:homocysteine S-methyltransferase
MVVLAPTWRANPERVAEAGLGDAGSLNRECVEFVDAIRNDYPDIKEEVFVGGLLACKNDAYKPEEALGKNEAASFHKTQIDALAASGVDFIIASTLPARSEAAGIARVLGGTGIPYVLSFVVGRDGRLLDGGSLENTIKAIDESVANSPPFFYALNCVHPSVCERALWSPSNGTKTAAGALGRIKGLQANTSLKTPAELEGLEELDTEDPDSFADAMIRVHRRGGVNVLGGCCGTDERHIRAIASGLSGH